MILLIKPCREYEEDIFKYKEEMLAAGDVSMDGCGFLQNYTSLDEWYRFLDSIADKKSMDPSTGFVEGSQYLMVDDVHHKILGMVNLRHELNDFLLRAGGHIGYSIRPDERRKGYGKLQLQLALKKMAELGVRNVLVTCNRDNEASARIIESCGGVLENETYAEEFHCVVKRYWIPN